MIKNILPLFSVLIFSSFLAINVGKSQTLSGSVITPYDADLNVSEGSISSTMGEILTETYHESDFLTQGFHQPIYQLEIIDGILDSIPFIVFPNPVTDYLGFRITWQGQYTVQLFDLSGKQIHFEEKYAFLEMETHYLDMSEYRHAIYLLIVDAIDSERSYAIKISKH